MSSLGYALSSEEHSPLDLVRHAQRAEEAGFEFALISDHFHPWVSEQGHAPFVWSVIGAIAQATERLRLGTGVTCPTFRTHPAIIAQAAATSAAMMPGRFFLGLGTGENLNEHILGHRWPAWDLRAEKLEEAVEIIRQLWTGEEITHRGQHYRVENARLFTLPDQAPPIHIAASGPKAAELAGRIGDGLINVAPKAEIVSAFDAAGEAGRPHYGQMTVCWAENEEEARQTAHRIWPNGGLTGELTQELPTPAHFEQAVEMVSPDDVCEKLVCGPDPEKHIEQLRAYVKAGYEHVYVHQVGPDQEGFIRFYEKEIMPHWQAEAVPA